MWQDRASRQGGQGVIGGLLALAGLSLGILIAPGPTNALFAIVAASRGWRVAMRLLPAVLLAYLAVVAPLAAFGQVVLAGLPRATPVLQGAAALWVAWLAFRLWRGGGEAGPRRDIGPGVMALTTALNPKALLFGLVILPGAAAVPLLAGLAVFLSCVALSSLGWSLAGGLITGQGEGRVRRGAAVVLGLLAGALGAASLS